MLEDAAEAVGGKREAELLAQLAQGGGARTLGALCAAARKIPEAAIGGLHHQDLVRVPKRDERAAMHRPTQRPPDPRQQISGAQGGAVSGGDDLLRWRA